MHSDILNYTKLAFNSLKMIQNDSLSANQTGDDRPLKEQLNFLVSVSSEESYCLVTFTMIYISQILLLFFLREFQ